MNIFLSVLLDNGPTNPGFKLCFFLVILFLMYCSYKLGAQWEQKRKKALPQEAKRLGLSYSSSNDYTCGTEFKWVNSMNRGSSRYGFECFRGSFKEQSVQAFSYHYEIHSISGKGQNTISHFYLNVYSIRCPVDAPELTIMRENFSSKLVKLLGYDDINFESYEFSNAFRVHSKDKKFAYDICHPLAMEYLLANQDLNIEMQGDGLVFIFEGRIKADEIEKNLERLVQFRELVPQYLLTKEHS